MTRIRRFVVRLAASASLAAVLAGCPTDYPSGHFPATASLRGSPRPTSTPTTAPNPGGWRSQ